MKSVTIIGAGLAGCEAAWQAAKRGFHVNILEMRPVRMTKAHRTGGFAELVCSNSLRGAALSNAVGLLKEELRILDSLIMKAADASAVPAGGALAVDREAFSAFIENALRTHRNISCTCAEAVSIPPFSRENPVIVATGPLTGSSLVPEIEKLTGSGNLAFFDAISPIVLDESLDKSRIFAASRYDKGSGSDYLNVPLSKEEYEVFIEDIRSAEKSGGHEDVDSDIIDNLRPFDGCMPIEEMAKRGDDVLRYGPLKPVGLRDPATGRRPYAALQLRTENREKTMWNMVGMQTRMTHAAQLQVFRKLPGLAAADFVRLGSVHRNTFIQSPRCLGPALEMRQHPGLFFAGQITGVEGYVESAAAGLWAGVNAARVLGGRALMSLPSETAAGSLFAYITDPSRSDFQPMNISFGLIESCTSLPRVKPQSKQARRLEAAEKSLAAMREFVRQIQE